MDPVATPSKPVENWDAVRDEWIAAVEQLISEAETWAARNDWGTLRDPKTITEPALGAYTVPRLLIHAIFGRLLLDPVARRVPGATGLVDFFVIPSYDSLLIIRTPEGWFLLEDDAEGPRVPWSEQALVNAAKRLSTRA